MKRKDQVLALVDRKEFTYQQIADQLDCSTGYVSACSHRPQQGYAGRNAVSTYDAADNSAKCYSLAVHELRLQGLREGKFKPLDLAEELIASGKAKDYRRIGPHTLYNGDCAEIMPLLGKFDAVVTDPPYGIGKDGQKKTTGGNGGRKAYDFLGWDRERPEKEIFDAMREISRDQVIWGGNYFADYLPASGKWLVWDKGQRINQSDGELAYTSREGALRIFTQNRVALLLEGASHPTQKPIEIMVWSVQQLPDAVAILDPFLGSGSTLIACQKLGRIGVGIERDSGYFAIACRRLEQAMAQPDLFIPTAPKQVQEVLL